MASRVLVMLCVTGGAKRNRRKNAFTAFHHCGELLGTYLKDLALLRQFIGTDPAVLANAFGQCCRRAFDDNKPLIVAIHHDTPRFVVVMY